MSIPPRLVSIEGLSGVGKSTISRILANEWGAEIIATVPKEFDGLRRFLDRSDMNSIHARFCFFLSAVLYNEKNIRTALTDGRNVVVESYLFRTIASHRGMGSGLSIGFPQDILMPNPALYLTCEEGERRQRCNRRVKEKTFWDELAEQQAAMVLYEYSQFNMTPIDTTHQAPEAVVASILKILQKGTDHENKERMG